MPSGKELHLDEVIALGRSEIAIPQACELGVAVMLAGPGDEGLVELLVAHQPVLQQPFGALWSGAAKGPVGLVDSAFAEHRGEALQRLGSLGEDDYAADGTVQPVGDAHEHLPGLGV